MAEIRQSSFLALYYKYKNTPYFMGAIFVVVCLVSIFLVLNFIVPQFQHWLEGNSEVQETRSKVAALNSNISFLEGLDAKAVDDDYQTVTTAFPIDKDFSGALQQILSSAITSGVSLSKFSFAVGELSTKSATLKSDSQPQPQSADSDMMKILLSATGDALAMKDFISSLSQQIPFSQVLVVAAGDDKESKITILYPNEPVKDASFDKVTPITPYTAKQRQLLEQLAVWKGNSQGVSVDSGISGSGSGSLQQRPFSP